eukprot:scaffold5864_cov93-Skeletonema_dohrnii-CCMP3373.AAC.4
MRCRAGACPHSRDRGSQQWKHGELVYGASLCYLWSSPLCVEVILTTMRYSCWINWLFELLFMSYISCAS